MPNSLASSAINSSTKKLYYLKALQGHFKGKSFKLTSKEIYIGRDKANHLHIAEDKKLSRRHARFIFHEGKLYVQNLSAKNYIKVNNETTKQAELHNNYLVSIGGQVFKVIEQEGTVSTGLSTLGQKGLANPSSNAMNPSPNTGGAPALRASNENKKRVFLIGGLIGVLALASLFLGGNSQVSKQKAREIATTEKLYERLDRSEKELEKLEEEFAKSDKSSPDYQKAQSFFIKGFRDFQQGLYASAASSFETSLSLFPEHLLARRYIELAQVRMEELINFHMKEGRIHLDHGQYDLCIAAFKNAAAQMYNKSDVRHQKALSLQKRCEFYKRSKY